MPLLKKKRVLAAATETTAYTAETLVSGDALFDAYDVMIQANIEGGQREAERVFGTRAAPGGARGGTATFKVDLKWDGTATLPNWATILLPACGYVNATGTLTPRSEAPGANVKTLTLGSYQDGMFKQLVGAAGTFRIVGVSGSPMAIEFTFQGAYSTPSDVAIVSSTAQDGTIFRYANATTTFGGVALCVQNIAFDAGNEVVLRECATTEGYEGAIIVDRKPQYTLDPEAVLVATDDRFTEWVAGTEAAFALTLDGPGISTIEIDAPKAQIINMQEADRNKIVTDDITIACNKNVSANDQDVSIIFTNIV